MLATVLATVLSAGCRGRTPTSPEAPDDLTGTWRGTITDSAAGPAQLTLTLRQLPGSGFVGFTGSWTASFPPGVRTGSGIVTGLQNTVTGSWLFYLDPPGFPPCFNQPAPFGTHGEGFELNVTRSGNRLTGTSTYRTCQEAFDGSVDVRR